MSTRKKPPGCGPERLARRLPASILTPNIALRNRPLRLLPRRAGSRLTQFLHGSPLRARARFVCE